MEPRTEPTAGERRVGAAREAAWMRPRGKPGAISHVYLMHPGEINQKLWTLCGKRFSPDLDLVRGNASSHCRTCKRVVKSIRLLDKEI